MPRKGLWAPFGVTGERGPLLPSGGPFRGGASRGDRVRSPDSPQLSQPQGSFLFSQFFQASWPFLHLPAAPNADLMDGGWWVVAGIMAVVLMCPHNTGLSWQPAVLFSWRQA